MRSNDIPAVLIIIFIFIIGLGFSRGVSPHNVSAADTYTSSIQKAGICRVQSPTNGIELYLFNSEVRISISKGKMLYISWLAETACNDYTLKAAEYDKTTDEELLPVIVSITDGICRVQTNEELSEKFHTVIEIELPYAGFTEKMSIKGFSSVVQLTNSIEIPVSVCGDKLNFSTVIHNGDIDTDIINGSVRIHAGQLDNADILIQNGNIDAEFTATAASKINMAVTTGNINIVCSASEDTAIYASSKIGTVDFKRLTP